MLKYYFMGEIKFEDIILKNMTYSHIPKCTQIASRVKVHEMRGKKFATLVMS